MLDWQSALATKFIDDKLIDAVAQKDGEIRQIVLLTDGMDGRAYKLPWPHATLIFHVSSGPGFKLPESKRSELPKSCLYRHVTVEPDEATTELQEGWTQRLRRVGYQGDRPSIWAMQGFEYLRSNGVQDILMSVSRLAMKGSFLVGELPITEMGCTAEKAANQHLEKLFMSYGFRIKSVSYERLGQGDSSVDRGHIRALFVAEQLRLSDDQVTKAMREIELAEEAGDEDSFEDW